LNAKFRVALHHRGVSLNQLKALVQRYDSGVDAL
jgi:hypothetical protein